MKKNRLHCVIIYLATAKIKKQSCEKLSSPHDSAVCITTFNSNMN